MRRLLAVAVLALVLVGLPGEAKVVNENTDTLPPGCEAVQGEVSVTVEGGTGPAKGVPGVVYTFDKHSWNVPSCARVTVTFVNNDAVRHQFMIHGTYPEGFTLIEVDGPGQDTGTFITPSFPMTLMAHCGVAQHQQKGMKAQFLVDGGVGDIPNIVGISGVSSGDLSQATTPRFNAEDGWVYLTAAVLGLAAVAGVAWASMRRR